MERIAVIDICTKFVLIFDNGFDIHVINHLLIGSPKGFEIESRYISR